MRGWIRSIKLQHESEGEEQRRKEAAAAERKRKAEEKETWESGREERVAGWRSFAKGGGKKKVSCVGREGLGARKRCGARKGKGR